MESVENSTELVGSLARGEESAWRRFMKTHGRLAFLAARKLGLEAAEQDEVFQETCLSVYRSIGSLRDPEKLPSWVYHIARRHALRLLSRRRPEVSIGGVEPFEIPVEDSLSALDLAVRIDQAARVRRALEEMGPRCRRLLSAIYLDPACPSYAQIAEGEGIPVGSIGPTRARCLKKLRILLTGVSAGASTESIL